MIKPTVNSPRIPARAGSFYPGNEAGCRQAFEEFRREAAPLPALKPCRILGALAPHAGWRYSGFTGWRVLQALAQSTPRPETILIFATSHRPDVKQPSLQSQGQWKTPLGTIEIDEALAQKFLEQARMLNTPLLDFASAHEGDHAIEVLLPMLQEWLPEARFIPIAMPADADGSTLGKAAAWAVKAASKPCVALASSDLTHYGPNYYDFAPHGVGMAAHRWSKDVNDAAFLERVLKLDAEGAQKAARRDKSACGPAAVGAAIAFAKELGAKEGHLLEHVTSWERGKQGEPEDFVGYAGVVFV